MPNTPKKRDKRSQVILPQDLSKRAAQESARRDITVNAWGVEAIREKLERIDNGTDAGLGPLAGLDPDDRRRVEEVIKTFQLSKGDADFRSAWDANFHFLRKTLSRIPKDI